MSSYIFRGIDAPLWASVKEKASRHNVTLLGLVEGLLTTWLGSSGNLQAEVERAQTRQEWAWEHAAEIYKERDLLVRALSMQFPSHLMYRKGHQPAGAKKIIVCIHSPAGQLTWTIPDTMRAEYTHLELTANDWDGHKTADRMTRLGALKGKR